MTITRIASWVVLGGIVVNAALMACFYVVNQATKIYLPGERFPQIAGVDFSGATRHMQDAPCYVIRITSDDCPYCKADLPAYEAVLDVALDVACAVVELAPSADDMAEYPREGVAQFKFVEMSLAAALEPSLTPQTIVLDAERRIKWSRLGTLDEKALAEALAILAVLDSRSRRRR